MIEAALVVPKCTGGIGTVTLKLFRGLLLEGFHAKLIQLRNTNLAVMLFSDLLNTKHLGKFDIVIFMGSIPWPSHLLLKNTGTALFLHGFERHELLNAIRHGSLRASLGAMSLLSYWTFVKRLSKLDFFICHSVTACETNGVRKNCVILPQFVLSEEVELYEKLAQDFYRGMPQKNTIKVLTYSSFAESPRLLDNIHIISIMKRVSKSVNKRIELIMIDPKMAGQYIKHMSNLVIRRQGYMSRKNFLNLLANSDIYLERCIDEELRYTTLEAGLLGTPVAKITHPDYVSRQDYTSNHILCAKSREELIYKLTDYLKHVENLRAFYSKKMKEFVTTRRMWNVVKGSLIKRLVEVANRQI